MITLPNIYRTDCLNQNQIEYLARILPQPKAQTGRPSYTNLELLPGILRVLRSGMRWRDLDDKKCASNITHWRRLRFWQKRLGLKYAWEFILHKLSSKGRLDLTFASLDGSLIPSFNFLDTTGYSGKYKKTGTKISNLVDFKGIPFNIIFASGERHDLPMAIPTIFTNCIGRPGKLLADKGYDSDWFRSILRLNLISSNIAQREIKNRKIQENYDINLGKMRFKVERTNAWIKSFRRLRFRFDYTMKSFSALTYLGLIVICIRKLM